MKKYVSILVIINEFFMISLALLSGYLLVFEVMHTATPQQLYLIDKIDVTIAIIFMFEFFGTLFLANNRYSFLRSHWWELLATIPFTTPATQTLRLLRLVRVIRIFRIGAHVMITKKHGHD